MGQGVRGRGLVPRSIARLGRAERQPLRDGPVLARVRAANAARRETLRFPHPCPIPRAAGSTDGVRLNAALGARIQLRPRASARRHILLFTDYSIVE